MGPSLLDLPAEIRFMIYSYALPDHFEPRVVHHPSPPSKASHHQINDPWALYKTCRAIRDELPPISTDGITLILHKLPWLGANESFTKSKSVSLMGHSNSLWGKFVHMAPRVEKLRLSGPRISNPANYRQHRDQLQNLFDKVPMPRLQSVEVQPQQWNVEDYGLAFHMVRKLGLGKSNVSFLDRNGKMLNPPSDLLRLPEWAILSNKTVGCAQRAHI